ncbi:hypothetical protein PHMEG_0008407 [Phytophthora megakarya]|uniref:Ndc10 domain-containing protein n=1 Tax=Phytophthora megakarya TaxID=4795 RepID=A0A225WIU8_9STRA|nr:hypothetical protein PHMEG_0008407 [Phytophthora megakarya]
MSVTLTSVQKALVILSAVGSLTESDTATAPPPPNAKAIRNACISSETRKKYKGNIYVIKRWIRNELSKRTIARSGTLSGYQSEIKDLYRAKRIALPEEYGGCWDQGFGRVVADLPVNESGFELLSPHFRDNTDGSVTASLQKMFPVLAGEQNMKGVLQLCLASLVFHAQYFATEFPPNQSLVSTSIFTNTDVLNELHKNSRAERIAMDEANRNPSTRRYLQKPRPAATANGCSPWGVEKKRMECVLEKKGVAAGNITRALLREEMISLLVEVRLHHQTPHQTTPAQNAPRSNYTVHEERLGYPPYKGILPDDLDAHKKIATLSGWTTRMRHISNGIEATVGAPMPTPQDEPYVFELFKTGYEKLGLKPSQELRRAEQIKLTTVLRLV